MNVVRELLLPNLLAYLISLAANERSSAIAAERERNLRKALERGKDLQRALASTRSIRDELSIVCAEFARNRDRLGVAPQEEPLWRLLTDETFQATLAEWLVAGGIEEGQAAKNRLQAMMKEALASSGATTKQINFLETHYFETLDRALFTNPVLAHWRHQMSLDYLREQVASLRKHAEEAAGVYSGDRQNAALERYCEKELAAWDIIDLSGLPEGDIHMATQKLLLRQLYMPLRVVVEPALRGESEDEALGRLEDWRATRRYREAGHSVAKEPDRLGGTQQPFPIGYRMGIARRLVVLGDPGGGKTTMLRWLATAYLLRRKGHSDFGQLPDTETLPNQAWIPVLIRCRDLGDADLCRCFTDFLTQHLHKTELLPEDAQVMRSVILDRLAKGEVLLLVDGLDEITNPHVRMMFCQELERTAARYPSASIIVTSRIVGYRDMPYHMGSGFEHGVIAELTREDKDLFAQRWVELTEQHQPISERFTRARDLVAALHSSDRIERLTGNPMLLTALALVKRKVGKLPNRRTKLYAEVVSVLLNWNPKLYEVIEEEEAVPQLEYLAYEMCRQGIQQLAEEDVLDLLEGVRNEYPNVRAVRRREPPAFLALLEARSSILIKSGGLWQRKKKQEKAVWEFRHLTFQEYLAARALLDGRYPGRDRNKPLAQQASELAAPLERVTRPRTPVERDVDVAEAWREALRLLVADCKDDDVDEVVLAILRPSANEDASKASRPRAALATLCLADEPNVSEETACEVLATFAAAIGEHDGIGRPGTSIDTAAIEAGCSMWSHLLKKALMEQISERTWDRRWSIGGLWGMAEVTCWRRSNTSPTAFFTKIVERLRSGNRVEMLSAAFAVMEAAYEGGAHIVDGLVSSLLDLLETDDAAASFAAAWALGWLSGPERSAKLVGPHRPGGERWAPGPADVDRVVRALDGGTDAGARRWLAVVLGGSGNSRAIPSLTHCLNDPDAGLRRAVVGALGRLGDMRATAPLLAKLDEPDARVRGEVVESLVRLANPELAAQLIAKLSHSNPHVRATATEALGKLGGRQAVVPLLAKIDDSASDVRIAAIEALGELGAKQAVVPLLAKIDDSASDVRIAAIKALGELGDKRAVVPLQARTDGPESDVRYAAIEALRRLRQTGRRAVASENRRSRERHS